MSIVVNNLPQGGGGGVIKSIQRGIAKLDSVSSIDVTINEVDTTSSIVVIKGLTSFYGGNYRIFETIHSIELIDSTTIRIQRGSVDGDCDVVWEVIEFDNVKSLQKGTVSGLTVGVDNDITINSVDVNKTMVFTSFRNSLGTSNSYELLQATYLKNATTLTTKGVTGVDTATVNWQVIEFN